MAKVLSLILIFASALLLVPTYSPIYAVTNCQDQGITVSQSPNPAPKATTASDPVQVTLTFVTVANNFGTGYYRLQFGSGPTKGYSFIGQAQGNKVQLILQNYQNGSFNEFSPGTHTGTLMNSDPKGNTTDSVCQFTYTVGNGATCLTNISPNDPRDNEPIDYRVDSAPFPDGTYPVCFVNSKYPTNENNNPPPTIKLGDISISNQSGDAWTSPLQAQTGTIYIPTNWYDQCGVPPRFPLVPPNQNLGNNSTCKEPVTVVPSNGQTPRPKQTASPSGAPVQCTADDIKNNKCTSSAGQICNPSTGDSEQFSPDPNNPNPPAGIQTAIGCIPTNLNQLIPAILQVALFAGGAISLLLMIFGAIGMILSNGSPEALKNASGRFTSAAIGLVFVIFAVLLLKIIGADILNIPGFGSSLPTSTGS